MMNFPIQESNPDQAARFGVTWASYPADLVTPVAALGLLREAGLEPCLLESVDGPSSLTAWSLLGVSPDASLTVHADAGLLERRGLASTTLEGPGHVALRQAREIVGTRPQHDLEGMPPLLGGWVGCFTYEWATFLEPSLETSRSQAGPFADLPHAFFKHYRDLVAFDHRRQRLLVITGCKGGSEDFESAEERRAHITEVLSGSLPTRESKPTSNGKPSVPSALPSSLEHAAFTNAVESMQADIGAGEYFQAVLSRRQESPPTTDPLELYRCLRLSNSSPHMFFFESEWATLVGSSPERLVSLEGALCETVPIAGTRPRAANTDEDRKLGAELLADSKERAEHDMLVDLARNDLGRVSQVGSITVPQYATLTRFPKVQHLVSRVEARLRNDLDALDLLAACFPAGTVSGAPKIRAMKAIAQHENEARGPYGGAFGYLSDDGNLDMAIVIRTFVIHAGQVHIQAGAGIVWDSIPDSEFEETGHKAKGMLEALTLSQSPAFQRPLCQSPTLPTS